MTSKITKTIILDAIKKKKAEILREELNYIRFRDDFGSIPRGTVLTDKRIIYGYPHISRIFTLEKGVQRNIKQDKVYIEEKIDGFNVRIAKMNNKIYAFSRGGFLDRFSTEKARGMKLEKLFKNNRNYVLCGEMLGNTPYTKPTKNFDIKLYVFDIMNGKGNFLNCEKKYELIRKYSLGSVPLLAKCNRNELDKIKKIARSLNKSKKEGMVIKAANRETIAKYVTAESDIADIEEISDLFFDMPKGFFYQRILRSSFFVKDFDLDQDEYAKKLGLAFYKGLIKAIRRLEKEDELTEEFEIKIKDLGIWDDIRKHMSKEVKIEEVFRKKEKEGTRIRFLKKYKKTTKILRSMIKGKSIID